MARTLSGIFSGITEHISATPRWFTQAIAHTPEHHDIEVDGCRIHLRCWGERHLPGLLLVHGGGAHSGWWDHIAPLLAGSHRVVAPDLSGHGDSDTRNQYSLKAWAREIHAAAHAAEYDGPLTVVGHSMGGFVSGTLAFQTELSGAIIIDSPIRDKPPEEVLRVSNRRAKGYETREEIVSRFTSVPPQDVILPFIAAHIAVESVRETGDGWFWKFDPGVFAHALSATSPTPGETMKRLVADMPCQVGYLHSEYGLMTPEMTEFIGTALRHRGSLIELPDSGHHPMLDQPLLLASVIRTLLSAWSVSTQSASP